MIVIVTIVLILVESGALIHQHHESQRTQHDPAQSWDQANLKKDDHGCPTAVFIAPNGVLEQCP